MYSSENAGLVKFDLLGLKTLTVIDKTLKDLAIRKNLRKFLKLIKMIIKYLIFSQLVKLQVFSN